MTQRSHGISAVALLVCAILWCAASTAHASSQYIPGLGLSLSADPATGYYGYATKIDGVSQTPVARSAGASIADMGDTYFLAVSTTSTTTVSSGGHTYVYPDTQYKTLAGQVVSGADAISSMICDAAGQNFSATAIGLTSSYISNTSYVDSQGHVTPMARYVTLGYADNNALRYSNFGSLANTPTSVGTMLVRTTYRGDALLQGTVNWDDYLYWQQGYSLVLSGHTIAPKDLWRNGDYNDDGHINWDDYLVWQQSYSAALSNLLPKLPSSGGVLAAAPSITGPVYLSDVALAAPLMAQGSAPTAPVPEPGTLSLLAAAAAAFTAYYRRRRSSHFTKSEAIANIPDSIP